MIDSLATSLNDALKEQKRLSTIWGEYLCIADGRLNGLAECSALTNLTKVLKNDVTRRHICADKYLKHYPCYLTSAFHNTCF